MRRMRCPFPPGCESLVAMACAGASLPAPPTSATSASAAAMTAAISAAVCLPAAGMAQPQLTLLLPILLQDALRQAIQQDPSLLAKHPELAAVASKVSRSSDRAAGL